MTAIAPLRRLIGSTASSCSRKVGGPLNLNSNSRAAAAAASSVLVTAADPHNKNNPHQQQQQHQQQEQRRSFWMEVVTRKPQQQNSRFGKQQKQLQQQQQSSSDNNNKASSVDNYSHEDPEQVVRRHTDETRSDGEPLLDLMFFNDRHEKAWRKRQRLKSKSRYDFDKKHVNDLAKYIAFVKDNKETTK